jgi:putative ABC transport system substrate-binding protein
MRRRRQLIIAATAFSALCFARLAIGQARREPARIGWLVFASRATNGHWLAAFREGLAEFGWKEGTDIVIEERWAEGRIERLPALAAELAAMKLALIVAAPTQSVAAVAKAAPRTPIVHATGADPVVTGLVPSLARPGGMITGLTNVVTDITGKQLELLLDVLPSAKHVGFLADGTNFARGPLMDAARRSVAQFKVGASFAEVMKPEEFAPALERMAKEGAKALIVMASPMLTNERRRIIDNARARRWPVIAIQREYVEDGALLSYGPDTAANYRRAAYYVDRILKGTKPGDLAIEQPAKIDFMVNLKAAKALGLNIPQTVLFRADRVIE